MKSQMTAPQNRPTEDTNVRQVGIVTDYFEMVQYLSNRNYLYMTVQVQKDTLPVMSMLSVY